MWKFNPPYLEFILRMVSVSQEIEAYTIFACSTMPFCRKCWIKVFENLITIFQNVFFIGCNISLSWYLHLKNALWGFNVNHLIFGDKNVTVLVVHMWNWLPKSLKRLLRFKKPQKLKRLLSDWFRARCTLHKKVSENTDQNNSEYGHFLRSCKCKVGSDLDN